MRSWLWLGIVMAATACTSSGGDKSDTDVDDTDAVVADTDVAVDDTDAPGDTDVVDACLVGDDLGELALNDGAVITGDDWYTVYQAINDDTLPDYFQVELYGGTDQFPGLPEPGTYELSGANAQYSSCGVCVLLLADVDGDGIPSQVFLATSGTVTVTSVASTVSGTYSNLVFEAVEIDPNSYVSTPAGECASASASGSFSAVVP